MKSIKNLIVPAAVLLALIVFAIVWFAIPKKDDEPEVSDEAKNVLSISCEEIARFSMHKKSGEDIIFVSETDAELGTQTWSIEGSGMEISQSAVLSYVSMLSSYTATSTVIEPDSLSDYSLEDPDYTIEITKEDGTVETLYIGSYTFDSKGVYFMLDGDPNVYITAKLKRDYCDKTLNDFASTKILELDLSEVTTVEFIRTSDNTDIVTVPVEKNGSFEHPGFDVISPLECPASERYENLVEFVAGLQVTNFEDIPESDLSVYGLDDPAFEFIFTMDDGSEITVSLSLNLGGKYYGTCSEMDGYFSISEFQFNGVETPLLSLLDTYIADYEASEVSSITGTYGDDTFVFELNVNGTMGEAGSSANLNYRNAYVRVSEGGRTYAAILFDTITGMQYSGIDVDADPTLDPALTFTIVTNSYQIITIDFVERDPGSYYVFIDGEYTGFYVISSVLFSNGGSDLLNYGAWSAYELTVEAIDNSINGIYSISDSTDETSEEGSAEVSEAA